MVQLLFENEKQKKTIHPVERVALFHEQFEGIHPFIDGNERAGRLLLNLDLMQCGYPPINIKFTDRKRYYDVFDSYYKDNDAEAMIELIAEWSPLLSNKKLYRSNFFEHSGAMNKAFRLTYVFSSARWIFAHS